MAIIMREIQKVRPGQWEALKEAETKWNAFEARVGFPSGKRRCRVYSGVEDTNTIVVEFKFESLAALDAANKAAEADPEYQELIGELDSIIASNRVELYTVLD
jgi:hypothetical protein